MTTETTRTAITAADLRARLLAYAGSNMDQNERGGYLSFGTQGEMILVALQALAGQPPWLPAAQHSTAYPRLMGALSDAAGSGGIW